MTRNFSVSLETRDHFHYPELPEDGISVTYDRDTALAREDVNFLTWENPLVRQALDIAVTDVTGNSAMIAVQHPDLPSGTLLVETLHVVDCIAPPELMVDRFLPPRILRAVISPNLSDISSQLGFTDFEDEKLEVNTEALQKILETQVKGIRQMLTASREKALVALEELKIAAMVEATSRFENEINRLMALQKVNATIRDDEIEYLVAMKSLVRDAILNADMRLDAIRVIVAA